MFGGAIIAWIYALICIIGAYSTYRLGKKRLPYSSKVIGKVIDTCHDDNGPKGWDKGCISAVFEYTVDGIRYENKTPQCLGIRFKKRVGSPIKVKYDPANPSNSTIMISYYTVTVIVLAITGFILAAGGIVSLIFAILGY